MSIHHDGEAAASSVAGQLESFLSPHLIALLRHAASVAAQRGATLYVVGGTVRDMLLGRPQGDLDLVVEGDAIQLARALAAEWDGEVIAYAPFGTATLTLPQHTVELDFVMARREEYPQPAMLPQVTPSSLADDLLRRDFTVNALAICLSVESYGQLHDLFGGEADLRAKLLRVMHDGSFIDDPTRIVRAARLAARLGFALEPHTRALAVAALQSGMWERLAPQRLANELRLLFHEPAPEQAITLLNELGALPHLLPPLRWSEEQARQFAAARQAAVSADDLARLYFALAVYPLPASQREALIARFQPSAPLIRLLRDQSRLHERLPDLRAAQRNSAIDALLRGLDEMALRAAKLAEDAPVPELIARYLTDLRDIRLALRGDDLLALGVPLGPLVGQLLAGLRAAKLDGLVRTRADEEAWLRDRLGLL